MIFLIPLLVHNQMITLQRTWSPFRRDANGFSCPSCGEELRDRPGETIQTRPDTMTLFRNVFCERPKCGWTGKREIL